MARHYTALDLRQSELEYAAWQAHLAAEATAWVEPLDEPTARPDVCPGCGQAYDDLGDHAGGWWTDDEGCADCSCPSPEALAAWKRDEERERSWLPNLALVCAEVQDSGEDAGTTALKPAGAPDHVVIPRHVDRTTGAVTWDDIPF